MTNAIIFDTETTDSTDGELIEAAYIRVRLSDTGEVLPAGDAPFEQRYKPVTPISFGAMATHHILPEDIEDCPPSSSFVLPDGVEYLIGHAIDFDWGVIGSPAHVKRICTLAMARRLWPNVSHKLSALMYMFSNDYAKTREELRAAHSAMVDVNFCAILLDEITLATNITTLEALYEFSEECRVPTHMTFGKHNGMAIAELPLDYVGWFLGQADVDPYLRKAFEKRVRDERTARGLPPRVFPA